MNGFKEIGFSFAIALASILCLARLNTYLAGQPRMETPKEPTFASGEAADPGMALNWGLEAARIPQVNRGGGEGVTVALIDTGCDYHHPDLARNIWNNPGENGLAPDGSDRASNGLDDDGNGFVDDAHGWDFVSGTPAIMDDHGHGTHVAGIVAATAPRVRLMILKYYDTDNAGFQNLDHTVAAIRYAVANGAQVINYSGGGLIRNAAEEEALRWARARGVVVVAAAGNEGVNSDFYPFYPADYDLDNILSVTAVDRRGHLLDFSNYGRGTVDVAAPGKNIYSALPGGQHGYLTGTSQATAFVTGVAALLVASERFTTPADLISHVLAHGRALASLRDRVGNGQMLDAARALGLEGRTVAGRARED